jgi:hypothetical protein
MVLGDRSPVIAIRDGRIWYKWNLSCIRKGPTMLRLSAVTLTMIAFVSAASARNMMLTIYDDGLSCPGGCDAHVVMSRPQNGTRYAFRPGSSRSDPHKCISGDDCVICFGESDATCMHAKYRGEGPGVGRFDFTPAFYSENCSRSDIPTALKDQCGSLDQAARRLHYTDAIDCFDASDDPKCKAVMTDSQAAQ